MTELEKNEIRDQINRELSTLEKSIETLTELISAEVQSDANDWFTTKESNPSKEINEMALENTRKKIIALRDVLKRIDSDGFGICANCGKRIPFGRLKAVPSATRCLSCR